MKIKVLDFEKSAWGESESYKGRIKHHNLIVFANVMG